MTTTVSSLADAPGVRRTRPESPMGLAQWRTVIARSIVPLRVDEVGGVEFAGRLNQVSVDDIVCFEIAATPHVVRRTPSLIALSPRRYYKMSLQLEGAAILEQDGRRADISPGDLAIYDTHSPYTLRLVADSRALVVMFPPEVVELAPEEIGRLTARRFPHDTGLGRVINPFFVQLGRNLDQLSGSDGARLIRSALDLLVTLMQTELRRIDGGDPNPQRVLLRQIRGFVRDRLHDPSLTPAVIAQEHYISTRRLHAVFSGEQETVAAWIRSLRLEHIRRDLGDPLLAGRSVSAIAARWGLTDASHFSRVFKAEFGESPSAYRDRITRDEPAP